MKNSQQEQSRLSLASHGTLCHGIVGTQGTRLEKTFSLGNESESYIDVRLLENVRQRGHDIICACPACRMEGNDRKGDNLRVFSSGAFHCMAHPKDRDHNRKIFGLVGVRATKRIDPLVKRARLEEQKRQFQNERDKLELRAVARSLRADLVDRWAWNRPDIWEDSPQRIDCAFVESDPRWFLKSLYPDEAVIWTGEVYQSGQDGRYRDRWRTVREWQEESHVGPMVSPAIWTPKSESRATANISSSPYVVLDFDGFDGIKPSTPDELQDHVRASLAIIHWIYKGLNWDLAGILWTGGKSLHAWFRTPPQEALQSLADTAEPLGLDAGLIGRPEHPCRLPGQRHSKTGKLSKMIWLDNIR